MTRFIENVNAWLDGKCIKQTYVSMQSGIDVKKLSRILTGVQDVSGTDMEKIAAALGQPTEFFLQENFTIPAYPNVSYYPFYPAPTEQDKELETFTLHLLDLLRNADTVLSSYTLPVHPENDGEVFL